MAQFSKWDFTGRTRNYYYYFFFKSFVSRQIKSRGEYKRAAVADEWFLLLFHHKDQALCYIRNGDAIKMNGDLHH